MPRHEHNLPFLRLLRLLVGLRFTIAWRREGSVLGALPAAAFGLLLATTLAILATGLLQIAAKNAVSAIWLPFALTLLVFLTGLFWVLWPVLAARVEEAYELDRYLIYPPRPWRLYLAHTTMGFFEPTALLFYPLIGAILCFLLSTYQIATSLSSLATTAALTLAFVAMNVAVGRALLNLMLGALSSRRSAEWLTLAALALLTLTMFLPPVDASWLFARFGSFGANAADLVFLKQATVAMSNTPAGFFAHGLANIALARYPNALGFAGAMLAIALIAWLVGLFALLRFHRGGRRIIPRFRRAQSSVATKKTGRHGVAVDHPMAQAALRELQRLSRYPKVQLLFFVPIFLAILLDMVGGPKLLFYLWGRQWAANFSFLLGIYALSVWSGPLLANAFGYDGDGIIGSLVAPIGLATLLWGKRIAHGLLVALQQVLLVLFVYTRPDAYAEGLLLPLCGLISADLVALGLGALLSLHAPRRMHPTLKRRDRPAGHSIAAMLCALSAVGVLAFATRALAYAALPLLAVGATLVCYAANRYALRLVPAARERLLREIRLR